MTEEKINQVTFWLIIAGVVLIIGAMVIALGVLGMFLGGVFAIASGIAIRFFLLQPTPSS